MVIATTSVQFQFQLVPVLVIVSNYSSECCYAVQCGFDTLNQLIPSLSQNSTGKISKATTLHKGW